MPFTAHELAELAAFDAEVEATFSMTEEEAEASDNMDREIILEKSGRAGLSKYDYNNAWYKANKARILAKHKAYRDANKERIAAQRREYYQANKARILAKQKAYRSEHRELIAAQRKAQKARKEAAR